MNTAIKTSKQQILVVFLPFIIAHLILLLIFENSGYRVSLFFNSWTLILG